MRGFLIVQPGGTGASFHLVAKNSDGEGSEMKEFSGQVSPHQFLYLVVAMAGWNLGVIRGFSMIYVSSFALNGQCLG